MRAAIYVLLAAVTTSCLRSTAFKCLDGSDCGAAGVCEAIGYCSVPNPACAGTGRSFSDSAGPDLANACVPGGNPGIDAGIDAGLDAASDAPADAALPVACPAGYARIAGSAHYYKALGSSAWNPAAAACKAASPRAYLAVPDDSAELMILATVAPLPFWIGIDDQAVIGAFVTQTGGPATFLPWQGGHAGPSSENCVEVVSMSEIGTGVCGAAYVAVCECDP